MALDADVYLAARLVILRYGSDAGDWVSRRVGAFHAEGDAMGVALWTAILIAIEEIQGRGAKGGRVG